MGSQTSSLSPNDTKQPEIVSVNDSTNNKKRFAAKADYLMKNISVINGIIHGAAHGQLMQKFKEVKLKRKDVEEAIAVLDQYDNSESGRVISKIDLNVPRKEVQNYIESLRVVIGVDNEQFVSTGVNLSQMVYASKTETLLSHFSAQKTDLTSLCGYIIAIKQPNDSIAFAYAIYSMKLKPEISINIKNIEQLKDTYMKYKALLEFQKEGIIPAVRFEDGGV